VQASTGIIVWAVRQVGNSGKTAPRIVISAGWRKHTGQATVVVRTKSLFSKRSPITRLDHFIHALYMMATGSY